MCFILCHLCSLINTLTHKRGAFNKFPDIFLHRHLKLSCTLESSVCYCYTSYEMTDQFVWFQVQYEQLQQQLEYTLLKPECHSWWISKMQSGRENTLEERHAIKFCFKLGRIYRETYGMPQTAFGPSCMNRASVFIGIRDSKKAGNLWGMMRGVGRIRNSIHQSWLAKGLRLGLLCWGFNGVQEEIPSEEARTLQIGSVAFPPGQNTNPQLHPCHRLFDQDGHQDSSSASLLSRTCSLRFWLFSKLRDYRYETIEEMKKVVTKVIDTLTQEDFHGSSRSCWNGTTSGLHLEEITSKATRVSCVYYQ